MISEDELVESLRATAEQTTFTPPGKLESPKEELKKIHETLVINAERGIFGRHLQEHLDKDVPTMTLLVQILECLVVNVPDAPEQPAGPEVYGCNWNGGLPPQFARRKMGVADLTCANGSSTGSDGGPCGTADIDDGYAVFPGGGSSSGGSGSDGGVAGPAVEPAKCLECGGSVEVGSVRCRPCIQKAVDECWDYMCKILAHADVPDVRPDVVIGGE